MIIEHCRVCQGRCLQPFLDLGETALANSFAHPERLSDPEPVFPLRVVLCADCGLVQIDEEVAPDVLFKNYIYVSGTSDLIVRHARWLTQHFTEHYDLRRRDLVVELASNDGTVLKLFGQRGVRPLGIEPAENIAERANQAGIETLPVFFDQATALRVREEYGPARLVLGRHVLAHVADLLGFVRGMCTLLADDGVAAVEVPCLYPFYTNLEYDTVYHEHLCYFSVRVLKRLFESCGLELIDVHEVPIHGGSILLCAQKQGGPRRVETSVARLVQRDEQAGLHRLEPWLQFARRVADNRSQLLSELDRLRQSGRTLAGYGAPAKGMTLLSYCGIGPHQLPYLVDKSPYKQGLWTPGHHIPIHAPERLMADQPDVLLVLAWNFADEIALQQAEYRRRGGMLLLPIPQPHYWQSSHLVQAA